MVGRLRRRTVLASVSTGAAAATAGCLLGGTEPAPIEGSWPMRGHDAAYTFHDGGSSPPAGPPTTDWRASFSAEQGSVALLPPLVGHERVYLTVHRETSPNAEPERTLRAVRSGGESVWHVTGPNTLQDGTVLSGGILVFADPTTAGLVGVDATDGDTVWRFTPEGGTASFSRVADGTAYATAATDSWVATDAAEGHRRHRFPIGDVDGVYNRFALADGHIVAHSGRDGRLLRSIDATTGEEDWRRRLDADVAVGPTVVDDLAIVRLDAPRRGAVVAHSLADGSERWRTTFDHRIGSRLVTDGDRVVVPVVTAGGGVRLVALDPADGEERWRSEHAYGAVGSPIGAGDAIVAHDGDDVFAVGLGDGGHRWRQSVRGVDAVRDLVVAGSTVYLTVDWGHDGALVALS